MKFLYLFQFFIMVFTLVFTFLMAAENVPLYSVHEVVFEGPQFGPSDTPARDVEFYTEWQHEDGGPVYRIYGFWDGDGKGGTTGNTFKIRFCPTRTGKWILRKAVSNRNELNGQNEGYSIVCTASGRHGFWEVDTENAGGRWYKRSDGTHQYIIGNTMYSFLSEMRDNGPTHSTIARDVKENSRYFKKIRFSIMGDRYPHPIEKPFLDNNGKPTDDGNFSHRPNPAWFHNRVDLAVKEAFEFDLIVDLILNGPDTEYSRSALLAAENGGDCTPYLRYIAARYGSYPNVWICLANEWNIKKPKFTAEQIKIFGHRIRQYLPYPTPVSIHAAPTDWNAHLNTIIPWNDHIILQYKIKLLPIAADFIEKNYWIGGGNKPVIDDELAYQGEGDGWSEADVIEAHLGVFLGGGYGTTGFKHPKTKQGHYFWGAFKPEEHTAADNLQWFRKIVDEKITFWKMTPAVHLRFWGKTLGLSIFRNIAESFRVLEWKNKEYILGTNKARSNIQAHLPKGIWQITQYDLIKKEKIQMAAAATGKFKFDTPASRAVMFHFKKIGD